MSRNKARNYDKEFKLNAVRLYLESGRGFKKIADELGVPFSTLVGWVDDHKKAGAEAFPGKGHVKPSDMEVLKLRKELTMVREERDILKKALGIFSSQYK